MMTMQDGPATSILTPPPCAANDSQPVTDRLVAEVAEEAEAHERSVLRRLLGLRVRGRAGIRIDRILAARGLAR